MVSDGDGNGFDFPQNILFVREPSVQMRPTTVQKRPPIIIRPTISQRKVSLGSDCSDAKKRNVPFPSILPPKKSSNGPNVKSPIRHQLRWPQREQRAGENAPRV
jgi:hypothetical protein